LLLRTISVRIIYGATAPLKVRYTMNTSTQHEIVNLSAFRQVNADGSSFISCQGVHPELGHIEFTCSDEDIFPVSTGNLVPLKDNPNRSLVQVKRTCGVALVCAQVNAEKKPHEFNGVVVTPVRYSRIAHIIAAPVTVTWGTAAARKPAPQVPASGEDTGAIG